MSEKIALALPCWAPPEFPADGRLLLTQQQVNDNYKKQIVEEGQYQRKKREETGGVRVPVCCQSLHISLFFDGTGNNDENDTKIARPPHPTNIAKLFHATYELFERGYFRYYMPGVGTPFPKINEFDYSTSGLAFASGGEDRINWALLRLVDALMISVQPGHQGLSDRIARHHIVKMRAPWPISGKLTRCRAIGKLLEPLRSGVKYSRPHLLGIKLFIYGFSRGAAEARAFVSWLAELFEDPAGGAAEMSLLGLPVSVEFLGLLDTVASVGIAHLAPGATGHMAWAEDTQQLPDATRFHGLVKCCRHFIAAHEQRLSFPLDSVRRPEGHYPDAVQEVIYPGMHSDVGGGYPPGDQGKSRGGAGELLSQIVLHDLYLAAFAAGAPLAIRPDLITALIKPIAPQREMDPKTQAEFDFSAKLLTRFNLWRRHTLLDGVRPEDDAPPAQQHGYAPVLLPKTLESAIVNQMAWLTAWRIGRYAHSSQLTQPFYQQAPQKDAAGLAEEKQQYEQKVAARRQLLEKARREGRTWQGDMEPGPPVYDPTNAQYQLREAAREFEHDYYHWFRDVNGNPRERVAQIALDGVLKYPVYLLNGDDEKKEYERMRSGGDYRYAHFFTDRLGTRTHKAPMAELLAFYDEQLHDSRAWFMQSTLGGREPWGGYFRYRMIYCGDQANKQLQLIYVQRRVIGAAPTSGPVEYIIESREEQGWVIDVHKLRDLTTGQIQLLSPAAMSAPSTTPQRVAAQQRTEIINREEQAMMTASVARLKQSGAIVV